mgnify:FL=1
MKIIIATIILSLCLAETKIGWVDSQYIFNQLEETREAQVELEKKQRSLESELMSMVARGDSLYQVFQKQAPLMGPEMIKVKEQELIAYQQKVEMFQMQKLGPEGELYTFYGQLIAPIEKKILAAIAKVGDVKGYDYILDASRGGIVHALDSHKLDEDVLEELRKDTPSE